MTNPREKRIPDEGSPAVDGPDGLSALVRRVLAAGPTPEERLEQLLAERRHELEEHAARLDETISDLERREELLRDSRASVERLLRLGTSDLEAKESDLSELVKELANRETRLHAAEADLARRRGDLGAVELRRAAIEQRERALDAREQHIAQLEAHVAESETTHNPYVRSAADKPTLLAFVPGPEYRLVEIDEPPLAAGATLELGDDQYVVGRTGPSPLPGDPRRCAYLVQVRRGASPSGGSS